MLAHVPLVQVQPHMQGLVAAYLAEVAQRTGSVRTPAEYGRLVERFLTVVGELAAATPAHVHAFAYGPGPSGRDPSPSTVTVRLAAVKGLYDFARRMGLVGANPANEVKRPHQRPPTPRGLSSAELRRLLATVPSTPAGLRDRAIILTCVLTGLRRQEVMGLRAGDLTRDGEATYYHVRAKGGVQRRRELPTPAVTAISAALAAGGRPLERLPSDAPLFNVSHQGFYANLRRYAARAGLGGVTPHALRHSAAKLRRESGASIENVGALLGHRSLYTTARYLARLEGERDDGWHGVAAALGVG